MVGKQLLASRIFAFSEIRPSERSERAIPQSMTGGVGFLLKNKEIIKNKRLNYAFTVNFLSSLKISEGTLIFNLSRTLSIKALKAMYDTAIPDANNVLS